ncbi:MAG: hypothetical protein E7335_07820 [Clostridiales bacterium]|nr:hypothetical protein [Clostridiales bacterium]
MRKMLALICVMFLILPNAYAAKVYQSPIGEAHIGENNQIHIGDVTFSDEGTLITHILGADEQNLYYLVPGGTLADDMSVYTLMRTEITSRKSEAIAVNVFSATYLPGENTVFYVTADERMLIKAYPADKAGHTMRTDIEKLQATNQGLVVTAGGSDGLYFAGIGVMELPKEEQGAQYQMVAGLFDVITSVDGKLWVRFAGEGEKQLLAENTMITAYDAQHVMLYYIAGEAEKHFLHRFDPISRTVEKLKAAQELSRESIVAADGMLYILEEGILNGYCIENGSYVQIADLSEYELKEPSISYANGNVLIYDKMLGMDLFVESVHVKETDSEKKSTYSLLKNGSRGTEVTNLQRRLIDLNYLTDEADGIYGKLTEAAVKLLQSDLGLEESGIADEGFLKMIFTADIEPLELYATVKNGSRGTAVRKMQERLRTLQYLAGNADGIFGARTEEAVKAYQSQHGFKATGVADADMLSHLYSSTATKHSGYIELRKNDSGDMVKNLNSRLKELYYTSANATSSYSEQTVQAVKLYQKQMGMEANGIASPEMQRMLFSEYAQAYAGYADHLEGETGDRIYSAQLRLAELGYLHSNAVTGVLDKTTMQAVCDFQYEHALSVTGDLNVKTQERMYAANAAHAPQIMTDIEMQSALMYAEKYFPGAITEHNLIELLQMRLIGLNYLSNKMEPTGVYNRLTSEAVKRLQMSLGLVDVSQGLHLLGKMDEKVIKALMDPTTPAYKGTAAYYYN